MGDAPTSAADFSVSVRSSNVSSPDSAAVVVSSRLCISRAWSSPARKVATFAAVSASADGPRRSDIFFGLCPSLSYPDDALRAPYHTRTHTRPHAHAHTRTHTRPRTRPRTHAHTRPRTPTHAHARRETRQLRPGARMSRLWSVRLRPVRGPRRTGASADAAAAAAARTTRPVCPLLPPPASPPLDDASALGWCP